MQNINANPLQPPPRGIGGLSPRGLMPKLLGQVWRVLLGLLEMPFRYLFGRDLFISYKRSDSRKYAPNLALALQKRMPKLSFYLDRWIAPASGKLPLSLRLQLRWSSILVVVCTENAVASPFVQDEVARFAEFGRKVLTVDVDGHFNEVRGQAPWVDVSGADPEEENGKAVERGEPSPNVVERILKMVEFTTQDRRLRRAVWGTLAFVVLSVGGIGAYGYNANKKAKDAQGRAAAANTLAVAAEDRARTAAQQEASAKEAQRIAEQKERDASRKATEAEGLRAAAQKAQGIAEGLRASAEKKAGEALEKERTATAEAQKQQNIALARRLSAENNLAADPQSEEVEKKILLTVESMRLFPSREAYSNLVEGIMIMPRRLDKSASHTDEISEVALSPDGKYMATLSGGGLWLHKTDALATGGEIGEAQQMSRESERITSVAFSPDGAYLAAGYKDGVRLWLTKEMRELAPIPGSPAILFGAGSTYIAVLDNKSDAASHVVRVWRLEGEGAREVASATVGGKVSDVTFSADSKLFTTFVNEDDVNTRLDFWHTTGGPQTKPVAKPLRGALKAGFSPNAKYLWAESDTADGSVKQLLKADTHKSVLDGLRAIDFSPDGRFLVTTEYDPEYGELSETTVWDASGDSLRKLRSLGMTRVNQGSAGTFSPDGVRFAQLTKDKRVKVWNALTGQVIAYVRLDSDYKDLAFTHDGRFMAVATGKDVTLWPVGREWKSSEFVRMLREEKPDELLIAREWSNALSPNGKLMALAGEMNVTVLDAVNGRSVSHIRMPCEIEGLSFSRESERVVTHGPCGVWEWQIRSDKQPERIGDLPRSFKWVALSGDLRYAAGAGRGGAKVIELANPSNVVQLTSDAAARSGDDDEPAGESLFTVAFSGDGSRLAVANRSTIQVWEWRTRRLLHVIENKIRGSEDYNSVVAVAFDENDNDTLITADMYEALVWNLRDSTVVGRVELQETGRNTNFLTTLSPNGKFVATTLHVFQTQDRGNHQKTIVWQLRPADVMKNACSRLQGARLSEPEWKKEFGTETFRETCEGSRLPVPDNDQQ